MTNLKEETLEALTAHKKAITDIKWVGRGDGSVKIDTELFFKLADEDYDSSYGSAEVNETLVVVGDDWWLERHEYDGSEWWEFKSIPILEANHKFGKTVFKEDYDETWTEMTNLEYLEQKFDKADK